MNSYHEAYTLDSVHADVNSLRNGVTVQHWLNALKQFDTINADDYSDGYTVNYWQGDQDQDQEIVVHISHKHWFQTDQTEFIRMRAYHQMGFESRQNPGTSIGSALVLWPYA